MIQARISELKAALSRFLDRVRQGEEVLITDRGRPVARIIPLGADQLDHAGRIAALERDGVVRRGTSQLPTDFWERERPPDAAGSVRQALLDERRDT